MSIDLEPIKIRIAELKEKLEQNIPGYSGILQFIHKEFKDQPELLYALDDEQIAVVINGLEKLHKVEVKEVKDKKPISKKQGNLLSEDDV